MFIIFVYSIITAILSLTERLAAMSRFVRSIGGVRHYATGVHRVPEKLCRSAVLAYLHSVGDPTGEYHPELLECDEPHMKEESPMVNESENNYLSEMADSQARSQNRS